MLKGLRFKLLLLMLLGFSGVRANLLDSLRVRESVMEEKPERVMLLNQMVPLEAKTDLNVAFRLAEEARELSERLPFREGEAWSRLELSKLYGISTLYDEAIEQALDAFHLFISLGDSVGLGKAELLLGSLYLESGMPVRAEDYFKSAKAVYVAREDYPNIIQANDLIARTFLVRKMPVKAQSLYENNLLMLDSVVSLPLWKVNTLVALGKVHGELQGEGPCRAYHENALAAYAELGGSPGVLFDIHYQYVMYLMDFGALEEALGHVLQLEALSASMEDQLPSRTRYYRARSRLEELRGFGDASLISFQRYTHLKDSLDEVEESTRDKNLRIAFASKHLMADIIRQRDIRDAQLSRQKAETKQAKLLRNTLLVGLLAVAIFVVMLIRSNRDKVRANRLLRSQQRAVKLQNKKLQEAKEEIQRINKELQESNDNLEETVENRTHALQKAIQDLSQVNERLDTFIYRASHDLRGPLVRMKGLVEVARVEDDGGGATPYLELLTVAADRMDRLLRKLILVRELPKDLPKPQRIVLNELVEEVRQELLASQEVKGLNIEVMGERDLVVECDRKRLVVILENLFENAFVFRQNVALEFIDIHVKLSSRDSGFWLEVEDHGIGIDPGQIGKVFDLFFRGAPQSVGNGVGLYLVREAVDSMGGRIFIESEPEQYTRVRIFIPYQAGAVSKAV